ncbi:tryptophan halogenase family protein [Lentzea indica]|uniref:tryptophan halogenase family protein n=1 Tax=Lentzea indica TaxID=2604800 RepID=UPI0028AB466D|nr:tryptophan halogenase family protein [Lentzea indica]
MDRRIGRVIILGGGTAGWMTASYLGKALQSTVDITVLEAPAIPKIGVGEATVPNLQRVFFDYLGIPEEEWMRECNASFKMAVKFVNWRTPGEGEVTPRLVDGRSDHFYHPFGILGSHDRVPLSHHWSDRHLRGETTLPYDYSCFVEPALMDANKAPKLSDGKAVVNYAWHFDAHLVADFLRRFATEKQGVAHVQDEMTEVLRDSRGFITALRTKTGRTLEADLFVDCSGFRGALINKVMEEPFLDQGDHLLCDSAVACPVPHDDEKHGVEPYTTAFAMKSGWAWKTPMLGRFGTGYVYSSEFVERDQATVDFCRLWGLDPEGTFNHIRFRVGRNRRSWVKNCVSIGLASCFLEPLESSGLYFTYAAIYQLVKHFPDRSFDQVLIDRFNREIADMFDETRDFIQAHFYFSPREDTPFWRANKEIVLSADMREKAAMYRAGLPVNPPIVGEGAYYANFEAEFKNFWTNGSYYCIFAGLGFLPEHEAPVLAYKPDSVPVADRLFAEVRQRQSELLTVLPSSYDYLRELHAR